MKRLYLATVGACLLGLLLPSTGMAAKADGKKAKLIAKYDTNGNGTVDADEMPALRKEVEADKDGALKAYDKDGDGKLSDEEIQAIKPGASGKSKTGETRNKSTGNKSKKEKSDESKQSDAVKDEGDSKEAGGEDAAKSE